jgi:small subunit ribosomal protein S6e
LPKSKLVVADPKIGKSTMYELDDDQFRIFKGLKIGSSVDGSSISIEGSLKVTGGSDHSGFPMRSDVLGGAKKYVLLTKGIGFREKKKGLKKRKLVRGNTITDEIYQINAILTSPPKKETSKKVSDETENSSIPKEKSTTNQEETIKEKSSEKNIISSPEEEKTDIKTPDKEPISSEKAK